MEKQKELFELKEIKQRHSKSKFFFLMTARKLGLLALPLIEKLSGLNKKEFKKDEIKKILFIQLYGAGDYLMSTPVIKAISKSFLKAEKILLTKEFIKPLAENNPFIDKVITENPKEKIDLCICLTQSLESTLIARKVSKLRVGFLYDNVVRSNGFEIKKQVSCWADKNNLTSWVDHYLLIAKSLGCKVDSKEYDLELKEKSKLKQKDFVVFSVGVRPGAEIKAWENKKFAELADKVIEKHLKPIVFLGSKNDTKRISKIISLTKNKSKCFDYSGKCSFVESAAIINDSGMLVTIDNGLMHIGFALRKPVIALFGATDPRRLFQFNKRNFLVYNETSCSPCYVKGLMKECKKESLECMKSITVKQVFEKIEKVLK
ncbi:MAG: glycosyltransferase family 9 protein [archaeon]